MRCPNCQSKDIVAIQGQSYCINCGQLVAGQSSKSERQTIASLVKVGITVPDQPPEKEQPSPKIVPISPSVVDAPKETSKRSLLSFAHKSSATKSNDSVQPVKNVATDIAPVKPTDSKVVDLKPAVVKPPTATATLAGGPAIKIKSHPFRISLSLASIIAGPIAIGFALALYLRTDSDVLLFALLPAALISVGTMTTLAQAALLYGLAKRHDGRGVDRKGWWQMAGQSSMELLQLNILTMLVVGVLVAAGYASWDGSGQLLGNMQIIRIILLALINGFLIWLAAGALVARRLASVAVVVNDIPLFTALRLGIGMYWHIGGHLLAATGESLGVKIVTAGVIAALGWVSIYLQAIVPAIGMPAVYAAAIFIGLLTILTVGLHVEVRLWLAQYRHWAPLCFPDKRKSMLAKPRNLRTKTS